jgi:DNA-binding transcriptional MocR family regulator
MSIVTSTRLVELLGEWRIRGAASERLAATMRSLVLDGRIALESRLPAERTLATTLGCSRATVTAAYDRLRTDGYIASRRGAGSFVTIPGGHRSAGDPIYSAGGLDLRVAALPAPAIVGDLAASAVKELPRWLDHHGYDPLGLPPLRNAIAERFTRRGLPTSPDQILVTNGALQALDLAIRALLARGRSALVEVPSYPAALDAFRRAGARLRAVPVTAEGWDLQALDMAARAHAPAIAYLMPDFQNPTGALIDEPARARVLRRLGRAGTHVVIDETFAELKLDDPSMPAPAACAGGARTITVGSLSKSVWGGLRVGWARADVQLIRRLAVVRASADMASPVLEQLVAARVFECLDEIVRERCALARERRAALISALERQLPEWSYTRPAGGLFIWARLPAPVSTSLCVLAGEHGLALTPGPRFGAAGLLERYLRLPYSARPEELERAIGILAAVAPAAHGRRGTLEASVAYAA